MLQGTLFCKAHQNCEGSPLSGWEPRINIELFNSPEVRESHNCYSFATNAYDPSLLHQCDGKPGCEPRFHQPGGTKDKANILRNAAARNCKTVEDLVGLDIPDVKRTSFKARCPVGTSKIAMVSVRGDVYHFYAQYPREGQRPYVNWLHKDGGNTVKEKDAEGNPIFNPEFASRDYRPASFLNYEDFCGFYCVPRNRKIQLARDD